MKVLKRFLAIVLTVCMVAGVFMNMPVAVKAADTTISITNNSFDSWIDSGLRYWDKGVADGVTTFSHASDDYLIIKRSKEASSSMHVLNSKVGSFEKYQLYELSYRYFGQEGSMEIQPLVEGVKGDVETWVYHKEQAVTSADTGDWVEKKMYFVVPDWDSMKVGFVATGAAGTCWIDDVNLVMKDTSATLTNDSFQDGMNGWNVSGATASVSAEHYHDGDNSSLFLNCNNYLTDMSVTPTAPMTVTGDTSYTLRAYVKSQNTEKSTISMDVEVYSAEAGKYEKHEGAEYILNAEDTLSGWTAIDVHMRGLDAEKTYNVFPKIVVSAGSSRIYLDDFQIIPESLAYETDFGVTEAGTPDGWTKNENITAVTLDNAYVESMRWFHANADTENSKAEIVSDGHSSAGALHYVKTETSVEERKQYELLPITNSISAPGNDTWFYYKNAEGNEASKAQIVDEGCYDEGALKLTNVYAQGADLYVRIVLSNPIPAGTYTVTANAKGTNQWDQAFAIRYGADVNMLHMYNCTADKWTKFSNTIEITETVSEIYLYLSQYQSTGDFFVDNISIVNQTTYIDYIGELGNFSKKIGSEDNTLLSIENSSVAPGYGSWFYYKGGTGDPAGKAEIVATGCEDKGALQLTNVYAQGADLFVKIVLNNPIPAGTYTVTANAKGTNQWDQAFAIRYGADVNMLHMYNCTADKWTKFSNTIEITEEVSEIYLYLSQYQSTGDFFVDNISIVNQETYVDYMEGYGDFSTYVQPVVTKEVQIEVPDAETGEYKVSLYAKGGLGTPSEFKILQQDSSIATPITDTQISEWKKYEGTIKIQKGDTLPVIRIVYGGYIGTTDLLIDKISVVNLTTGMDVLQGKGDFCTGGVTFANGATLYGQANTIIGRWDNVRTNCRYELSAGVTSDTTVRITFYRDNGQKVSSVTGVVNSAMSFNFTAPSCAYATITVSAEEEITINNLKIDLKSSTVLPKPTEKTGSPALAGSGLPTSEIKKDENGNPAIYFNGEKMEPAIYLRGDAEAETQYGIEYGQKLSDAGVEIIAIPLYLNGSGDCAGVWTADNTYNFSVFDEIIYQTLAGAESAKLLLQVNATPPDWWLEKNASEKSELHWSDGKAITYEGVSYSSDKWREDINAAIKAFVAHVNSKDYASQVLGTRLTAGHHYEWQYWGSGTYRAVDFSDDSLREFRAWLTDVYGTDAALQAAWGDNDVTLATAEIPTFDARESGQAVLETSQRNVVDYHLFMSDTATDALLDFAKTIKEASDNKWIVGTYNGYVTQGLSYEAIGVSHMAVDRLLESEYVDFICAPYNYGTRQNGMSASYYTMVDSIHKAGKLFIMECDQRTVLYQYGTEVSEAERASWGQSYTMTETIQQMKRNFANVISHGAGLWWYGMRGEWFDDEQLYSLMRTCNVELAKSLETPREKNDIAWIVDEDVIAYTSYNLDTSMQWYQTMFREQMQSFANAGSGYDMYYMSSLEREVNENGYNPNDDYDVYVITGVDFDNTERELIAKLKAEGKTVIFTYLAGAYNRDTNSYSATNMQDILGMTVKLDSTNAYPFAVNSGTYGVFGDATKSFVNPIAYVSDSSVETLGTIYGTDKTGLAKKTTNGCTVYYSSTATVPESLLREVVGATGTIYDSNSTDAVFAGNGYLGVNATFGGTRTLTLGGTYNVYDVFDGVYVGCGVNSIAVNLDAGETALYRLEDTDAVFDATFMDANGNGDLSGWYVNDCTTGDYLDVKNDNGNMVLTMTKGETAVYSDSDMASASSIVMSVEEGKEYAISMQVKGTGMAIITGYYFNDEGSQWFASSGIELNDSWQTLSGNVTIPAGYEKIQIRIIYRANAGKTMYLDDVSVNKRGYTSLEKWNGENFADQNQANINDIILESEGCNDAGSVHIVRDWSQAGTATDVKIAQTVNFEQGKKYVFKANIKGLARNEVTWLEGLYIQIPNNTFIWDKNNAAEKYTFDNNTSYAEWTEFTAQFTAGATGEQWLYIGVGIYGTANVYLDNICVYKVEDSNQTNLISNSNFGQEGGPQLISNGDMEEFSVYSLPTDDWTLENGSVKAVDARTYGANAVKLTAASGNAYMYAKTTGTTGGEKNSVRIYGSFLKGERALAKLICTAPGGAQTVYDLDSANPKNTETYVEAGEWILFSRTVVLQEGTTVQAAFGAADGTSVTFDNLGMEIVKDYPLGDATGSYEVDVLDLVRLKRFLQNEKTYVVKHVTDVDQNSTIEKADAPKLRDLLVN